MRAALNGVRLPVLLDARQAVTEIRPGRTIRTVGIHINTAWENNDHDAMIHIHTISSISITLQRTFELYFYLLIV